MARPDDDPASGGKRRGIGSRLLMVAACLWLLVALGGLMLITQELPYFAYEHEYLSASWQFWTGLALGVVTSAWVAAQAVRGRIERPRDYRWLAVVVAANILVGPFMGGYLPVRSALFVGVVYGAYLLLVWLSPALLPSAALAALLVKAAQLVSAGHGPAGPDRRSSFRRQWVAATLVLWLPYAMAMPWVAGLGRFSGTFVPGA